jgi:hypothetical protein
MLYREHAQTHAPIGLEVILGEHVMKGWTRKIVPHMGPLLFFPCRIIIFPMNTAILGYLAKGKSRLLGTIFLHELG